MTTATSSEYGMLEMPALGRSFKLGELYDARRDQIGPGYLPGSTSDNYEKQELTNTKIQTFQGKDVSTIFSRLEISSDLRLAILTKTLEFRGAASYLKQKSKSGTRAYSAVSYSLKTEIRQLKDCNVYVQRHSVSSFPNATHFVCKIQYGADVFFVFEGQTRSLERTKSWNVEAGAKAERLGVGTSARAGKSTDTFDAGETIQCQMSGDIFLDELPTSIEDAKALCKDIPKKIKPPHGVPVRVWLQPLPGADLLYRELSPHIAIWMQKTLEDLDEVLERLELLVDRDIWGQFPAMLGLVKQAKEPVANFSTLFKSHMGKLRSQIKGRERDENTAEDLLDRLEKTPLDVAKMKAWVETKEQEAAILDNICCTQRAAEPGVKCLVSLVVRIHCKKVDAYIQQIQEATKAYTKLYRDESNLEMDIPEPDWSPPSSYLLNKETKRKLQQFDCCYETHSNNSKIGFEVKEEEVGEPGEEGVYLGIHDRNSKVVKSAETDLLLPCPVQSLQIYRIGTMCLIKWKNELEGHILVTGYVVNYRRTGTDRHFERRTNGKTNFLSLRGSRLGKPYEIEVIPCCGDIVRGPSATTDVRLISADDSLDNPVLKKIAILSDGTVLGTDPDAGKIVVARDKTRQIVECHDWSPGGVAATSDGRILVADMEKDCIRVIDKQGKTLDMHQYGRNGEPFQCPWDVATDEDDNIYVVDNLSVQMLDRNGIFQKEVLSDLQINVVGFAARMGLLAIADKDTNTCELYTTDGKHILTLPTDDKTLCAPDGVAIDDEGNIYIVDDKRVRKYDREGASLGSMKAHWNQGAFNPGSIIWCRDRGLVISDVKRDVLWGISPDSLKDCVSHDKQSVKIIID